MKAKIEKIITDLGKLKKKENKLKEKLTTLLSKETGLITITKNIK